MQKSLVRKGLVCGIILLFVGASIIPSMSGTTVEKQGSIGNTLRGDTLYVGGSGPNNYTTIQDAVNDSVNGDTVFVYNGIYYEHVTVNKAIDLIGEDKNTTIIDGEGERDVVYVTADWVNISGFNIRNSDGWLDYGAIKVQANNTNIFSNIITNYGFRLGGGIRLSGDYNIIKNNTIVDNRVGIIGNGSFNTVIGNVFENCCQCIAMGLIFNSTFTMNLGVNFIGFISISGKGTDNNYISSYGNTVSLNTLVINSFDNIPYGASGITLQFAKDCNISYNTIDMLEPRPSENGKTHGVYMHWANNISIYGNHIANCYIGIRGINASNVTTVSNNITNCTYGIIFEIHQEPGNNHLLNNVNAEVKPNIIKKNNFLRVLFPARSLFVTLANMNYKYTIFEGNFWNRPRILPKLIIGFFKIFADWGIPIKLEFDMRPAQKPYNIPRVAI